MNLSTKILKLDFNERSDGSPDWVAAKLEQILETPLWKYPDRSVLKKAIADFYQLQAENVLTTNGADEAIQLILLCCSFNKLAIKKVLLPTPTFSMYEKGLQQWQLDYSVIQSNQDQSQDQQQIREQFEQTKNTLLILVRPNNPTGEMLPKEFIAELEKMAKANDSLLLLDEAYSDFADDNCEELLTISNNIIILKTLSKAYGLAALRVGYVLSSKAIISAIESIAMPFNVSSLSLQLATECFSENAQTEVKNYRQQIKKNRQQLESYLQQRDYRINSSAGNFIFITLPEKQCQMLKTLCGQNNIFIRGFNEPSLKNSVRITVPLDIEPIKSIFNQLQKPDVFCLDMDGTLIDVSSSYDKAIVETVRFFSTVEVSIEDINSLRTSGSYNNDWVLSKELLNQLDLEIELQLVIKKFQQFYLGTETTMGFISNEKSLMNPDTQKFFQQNNIVIVTGRPRLEAKMGTEHLNFDCPIISMDDVENTKPHPESIHKAMQLSQAKTAWMIGDNVDDIGSAVSAGVLAIGISEDKQKELYEAGAAVVLENINQIKQLV